MKPTQFWFSYFRFLYSPNCGPFVRLLCNNSTNTAAEGGFVVVVDVFVDCCRLLFFLGLLRRTGWEVTFVDKNFFFFFTRQVSSVLCFCWIVVVLVIAVVIENSVAGVDFLVTRKSGTNLLLLVELLTGMTPCPGTFLIFYLGKIFFFFHGVIFSLCVTL